MISILIRSYKFETKQYQVLPSRIEVQSRFYMLFFVDGEDQTPRKNCGCFELPTPGSL